MNGEKQYVPLRVILPVTSIGVFMSALDGSIVNVALPTISDALNTNINGVRWVVIVYLLTVTSVIGIAGSIGDTYGRKIIFQGGMLVFAFGSFLCSISTDLTTLIIARAIQAIGAAGLQANGLALVVTYINPKIRGRAIGLNSLVVAGSLTVGPPLGGILTDNFGWQSIFLINLPIAVLGIILVQFKIQETDKKDLGKLDYSGMVLFMITSFSFISGLSFISYSPYALILVFLSVVTGFLFIKVEQNHHNPILSVNIMKQKQITFGALSAILAFMGLNSLIFLLPFYFQDVRGLSETRTGLYLIVFPIALTIMAPPTGMLAEKITARKLASIGVFFEFIYILILGSLFIRRGENIPISIILLFAGLSGACLSVFTNSNGTSVMNASDKENLSVVSGILGLSRNIGFTLGVTVSSAIFTFNSVEESNPEKYARSLGITYVIMSLFVFLGLIISLNRGKEIINEY